MTGPTRRTVAEWIRGVALLATLGTLVCVVATSACVQTAECDVTVPCESGQICYDFVCRRTCTATEECGEGALCAPCLQDDAEGTIDHCFESSVSACVPEQAP